MWPLAQAASAIGGDKVAVDDVVPAGTDPLTFGPDAAQSGVLHTAGLVVEVGGGFQPSFEQAARGAPAVLEVRTKLGAGDPYVWLDPGTMIRVVKAVATAMAAANPPAAALYVRNAGAFEDQVQSLGIDWTSTLATCPGTNIVTPDGAFSAMAAAHGLTDTVIGPNPTPPQVAAAQARLRSGSAVAALSEPWVSDQGVERVAAAAGIRVHDIDTLAGAPQSAVPGGPGQDAYTALMEKNLALLSGALGCNANER